MPKKLEDINLTEEDVNYAMYPGRNELPSNSYYTNMYKFKSVQDYLKKLKRKKKNKSKTKMRKKAFLSLARLDNNADYSVDKVETMPPISNSSYLGQAMINGGIADHVTLGPDFFDRPVGSSLTYGLSKDTGEPISRDRISEIFTELTSAPINIGISPQESYIYGIPDGIHPISDKDMEYNPIGNSPEYGWVTTDMGNLTYKNKPWIG